MPGSFRRKTREGHHQERERDERGQHPERECRKLLQAWDQVGVIHVKGRPQDDVGPDHSDDVGNDPLLPHHAPDDWFLPKASCGIPAQSQSIAERSQNEEVGVGWQALDRQDGRCEKHHGVGPEIAISPIGGGALGVWARGMPARPVTPVVSPARACTTSGRKKERGRPSIIPSFLSSKLSPRSQVAVGKPPASAKTSMFVAHRGKGSIPLARSACTERV